MGAEYTCIVTRETITVPDKTPHFFKNGVLTIPVDCGWESAKNFTEHFKNGNLENIDKLEHDENHPQALLELLKTVGLFHKKYLIRFEADWADIPCEGYQAAFNNDNVVTETIWEMGITGALINAFDYLGVEMGSAVFCHNYYSAKQKYLNSVGDL